MKRFSLLVFLFFAVVGGYGQFAIVDERGDNLTEETIIAGMSLPLYTNFTQLGVEYVTFPDSASYSNEGPFPIGFDFQFYDLNLSEFQISPTGFISFGPYTTPIRWQNEVLPFSGLTHFKNSIYGCFMPWNPEGGSYVNIYRGKTDTLVISWCEVPFNRDPEQPFQSGTFQIVINSTDDILIHLIEIPYNYPNRPSPVGILSHDKMLHHYPLIPNRNQEVWTPLTSLESWHFSPDLTYTHYDVALINPSKPVLVPEYVTWHILDAFGNEIEEIGSDFMIRVNPDFETTYRAVLRTCWGEEIARDEILIKVDKLPTAFNPNSNEDINRTFKIPSESDYHMQIYNRWGQLVFEKKFGEPNLGWNGQMNNSGTDCPAGVYNWVIILETDSKSRVTNTGSVMLIR
jgi:gliding motility-associated-like protein